MGRRGSSARRLSLAVLCKLPSVVAALAAEHGIRVLRLQWLWLTSLVALCGGSSWTRGQTHEPCIGRGFLTAGPPGSPLRSCYDKKPRDDSQIPPFSLAFICFVFKSLTLLPSYLLLQLLACSWVGFLWVAVPPAPCSPVTRPI